MENKEKTRDTENTAEKWRKTVHHGHES